MVWIGIRGSIDITRDHAGLEQAKLMANYSRLPADVDAGGEPVKMAIDAPVMKDNPFQ